jgi:hypothetical protein
MFSGVITMYRLINDLIAGDLSCIKRTTDNAFIPFAVDNTDYANFKKDLADGAELQDVDGNVIDGIAYLEGLA